MILPAQYRHSKAERGERRGEIALYGSLQSFETKESLGGLEAYVDEKLKD